VRGRDFVILCYNRGGGTWVTVIQCILLVTQHRFFSSLWVRLRLIVEEWVKFHIHILLTCRSYLNNDSDCDCFACQFLVQSFFWGRGHFNLLYNIGGGLEKSYIVLHRMGKWSKNTIFQLHNMWTVPYPHLSLDISLLPASGKFVTRSGTLHILAYNDCIGNNNYYYYTHLTASFPE